MKIKTDVIPSKPEIFQLTVSGIVDEKWQEWFLGMTISSQTNQDGRPVTIFTGFVIDQSYLRGLMIKIWDLNLDLISVNKLEDT